MRSSHRYSISALPLAPRHALRAAAMIAGCLHARGADQPGRFMFGGEPATSDGALALTTPLAHSTPSTLDDTVLSRQRGGAAGFMMISAGTSWVNPTNGVTLWDEIAPPLPLPQPGDARTAQGNNVTYVRERHANAPDPLRDFPPPARAGTLRAQTPAQVDTPSAPVATGALEFQNVTGIVQINQTAGAGNTTANSFVLRPPAGTFF